MRRGIRLRALVVAAALTLVAVPASAKENSTYLALGDSYAFAYSPLLSPAQATNFTGYADDLATIRDLHLTNAACPGETSGSMISGTRPDNGCQDFRAVFPLHVTYSGAQLAYAVAFLRSHRHTDLVTVQIGGNDLLLLQTACLGDTTCILAGLPQTEAQMAMNLATTFSAIRRSGHYRHTLVAVPYFAFDYHDPAQVAVVGSLDAVIAAVAQRFGARVADVYGAFQRASAGAGGIPCFAGLQIATPGGPAPCDIHPSSAGHALIAAAILAVLGTEHPDN